MVTFRHQNVFFLCFYNRGAPKDITFGMASPFLYLTWEIWSPHKWGGHPCMLVCVFQSQGAREGGEVEADSQAGPEVWRDSELAAGDHPLPQANCLLSTLRPPCLPHGP